MCIRKNGQNHTTKTLGKISVSKDELGFRIQDIPKNLCPKTSILLPVIVRDYLRFYIDNTLSIGNCIEQAEPAHLRPITVITESERNDNNTSWVLWRNKILSVAEEFDKLARMEDYLYKGGVLEADRPQELLDKEKELSRKAFNDLAQILPDLWW